MARLHRAGEFRQGEEAAARFLERELPRADLVGRPVDAPDDWVIVANLVVPSGKGPRGVPLNAEIDLLVVAPHAVFVVEVKSWSPVTHGDARGWHVEGCGEPRKSPIRQVAHVASVINAETRSLWGRREARPPNVLPVVVMQGRVALGRISEPDTHIVFGADSRLVEHLTAVDARVAADSPHRDALFRFTRGVLKRYTGSEFRRPVVPARVNDYTVTSSLPPRGPVLVREARLPNDERRVLRFVPAVVSEQPGAERAHNDLYLREYEALRRLRGAGCVPHADAPQTWGDESYWVLATEPPRGAALADGRSPPAAAARAAAVAAAFAALAQVHDVGVAHRALTPHRVFRDRGGRFQFTDFYLARLSSAATVLDRRADVDPEGEFDPRFRAPEFAAVSARPPAERTQADWEACDVFSLAACLREWLAASPGPDLAAVLSPCLDPDPSRRPRAGDAARAAAAVCGGAGRAAESKPAGQLPEEALSDASAADVPVPAAWPAGAGRLSAERPGTPASRTGQPAAPRVGDYELCEEVSSGPSGVLFRARHAATGQAVLVKLVPADRVADPADRAAAAERLAREVQALAALDHPNVVRVVHAGVTAAGQYLVLEDEAGLTAGELVRHWGRLPAGPAAAVVAQAAAGAHHAHRHFRVHRNLCPANLLVTRGGRVKVLDFGLVRFNAGPLADSRLTAGRQVGAPGFVAPELSETGEATVRADVYALGCILAYLLAGPRGGQSAQSALAASTAPPGLRALAGEMTAADPADRPGTAAVVADRLAPFARGVDLGEFVRAGPAASPRPAARRIEAQLVDWLDRVRGRVAGVGEPR